MNRKFMTILAAVCGVCILVIFGEWFYVARAQKQAMNPTNALETKRSPDEMPNMAMIREPEAAYADLVSRPLFIKGRRPVDEPIPEAAQSVDIAARTLDWQLNGVYTTGKGLSALFSRSTAKVAKDNYRKIAIGTNLDGWKLVEIHKDKVLLKLGDQQKELLLRKPKPKDSAKNPNLPNNASSPPPNTPQPEAIPQPQPEFKFEPEATPQPEVIPPA